MGKRNRCTGVMRWLSGYWISFQRSNPGAMWWSYDWMDVMTLRWTRLPLPSHTSLANPNPLQTVPFLGYMACDPLATYTI